MGRSLIKTVNTDLFTDIIFLATRLNQTKLSFGHSLFLDPLISSLSFSFFLSFFSSLRSSLLFPETNAYTYILSLFLFSSLLSFLYY